MFKAGFSHLLLLSLCLLPAWSIAAPSEAHQVDEGPTRSMTAIGPDPLFHAPMLLAVESELDRAIRIVGQRTAGQVLRAETRIEDGERIHHIRVLTNDGRVQNWRVDRSGRILD